MTAADATLLETDRLRLTGWRAEQADDLLRLHGDPEVARYLANGKPWTAEQARAAIALWMQLFQSQRLGKLRLIRKSDDTFIGRAGFGLYPPTGEPEIGFALFREHWGQGYATEAATALRDWLFRETAWDHFIGIAARRNTASLAVLGRIGMLPTHTEWAFDMDCQFLLLNRPAA